MKPNFVCTELCTCMKADVESSLCTILRRRGPCIQIFEGKLVTQCRKFVFRLVIFPLVSFPSIFEPCGSERLEQRQLLSPKCAFLIQLGVKLWLVRSKVKTRQGADCVFYKIIQYSKCKNTFVFASWVLIFFLSRFSYYGFLTAMFNCFSQDSFFLNRSWRNKDRLI